MVYTKRALSKQAVIQHLQALVEEDWIVKRKLKYFVKRFLEDDRLSMYGAFFEMLAQSSMLLQKPLGERELGHNRNAKEFISEFSNRIGRYIAYVFIEALREPLPLRSKIVSDFIYQSIPLDLFLAIFRNAVPGEKEEHTIWKLGPNTYKK